MPNTIPVNHCPDVELTKLPSKSVVTYDGKQVKLGMAVYFRLSPGHAVNEYVVVSDRAIKRKDGYYIMVAGGRSVAAAMPALDFVVCKKLWWEFYQKRHGKRRTDG